MKKKMPKKAAKPQDHRIQKTWNSAVIRLAAENLVRNKRKQAVAALLLVSPALTTEEMALFFVAANYLHRKPNARYQMSAVQEEVQTLRDQVEKEVSAIAPIVKRVLKSHGIPTRRAGRPSP
jgi:hypothetical protein